MHVTNETEGNKTMETKECPIITIALHANAWNVKKKDKRNEV